MKFEEILPKFRNGANIARRKWIESASLKKYIYVEKKTKEIIAVDKYGGYMSYLDIDEILEDDWVIVSGTDYLYEEG